MVEVGAAMSAPATTCRHEWRWLPRPIFAIGELGKLGGARNVYCRDCGELGWGHGEAPNAPAVTVPAIPTTEGS